jgi:hypothetical protein
MSKEPHRKARSAEEPSGPFARALIATMTVAGVICLAIGGVRDGLTWRSGLSATALMALGIGFVAVGLLELEWLERLIGFIGFFEGPFGGPAQWFWASDGSLSDSIGRRRATALWVMVGFPLFIAGCLLALRVISF